MFSKKLSSRELFFHGMAMGILSTPILLLHLRTIYQIMLPGEVNISPGNAALSIFFLVALYHLMANTKDAKKFKGICTFTTEKWFWRGSWTSAFILSFIYLALHIETPL